MKKVTRRQFLKTGGATAGAVMVMSSLNLGTLWPAGEAAAEEAAAAVGAGQWVASGCNGCVGWCPLRVRVVDGKAVKITGNSESKWTRGKLCPRGRLNLQILYDPDRVKKPLKRTNPQKGRDQDPGWVEISWEEAIATIAGKLKELRDKGTPERFALFRGRYTPLDADLLYSRLAKAYGTPTLSPIAPSATRPTSRATGTPRAGMLTAPLTWRIRTTSSPSAPLSWRPTGPPRGSSRRGRWGAGAEPSGPGRWWWTPATR